MFWCVDFDRSQVADEVFYSGEVRGESAITREEDIGSVVVHTYEVRFLL